VEGKLDMEVESIDHVIMLLDYIDSLKKQDNKIGDISLLIDELAKRMDYIEGVKILFPDEQYSGFLTMRNWPRTFKQYIEERRQELLAKREDLYKEMSKEIEEVFQKIRGFKDTIKTVLAKGLNEAELEYDAEDEPSVDSMASGEKPRSLSAEEQAAKAAEA
jgi:DNA-binding transcriptional MerR regulator